MILVTGASGFTGHFVIKELQRRNVPVRLLVREASVEKAKGIDADMVIGDLADFATLYRAMDGVQGVIHPACTFNDVAVDVAAMGTLLDSWQSGSFVYVSSLDVYGFSESKPVREDSPLDETYSDYARAKILCERMLMAKAAAVGRNDFTILRAPHILGPHPKGHRRFSAQVENGKQILLPGTNEEEWSQYQDAWMDVRDLAWVAAEALERPTGGPLNILSDHFVWHDLFTEIIRLTGSASQIVHKPLIEMTDEERKEKKSQAQTWHFDNGLLCKRLGFEPRYTLNQTLADALT